MHIFSLVLEGIVATLLMTAFDYAVALFMRKRIKVVKILGTMLTGQTTPDRNLSESRAAIFTGVVAHYSVGVLFSITYHLLWGKGIGSPTIFSAGWFGLISGVIAVVVWRTFIAIHPKPPAIPLMDFLIVIFLAHFVFAGALFLMHYRIIEGA